MMSPPRKNKTYEQNISRPSGASIRNGRERRAAREAGFKLPLPLFQLPRGPIIPSAPPPPVPTLPGWVFQSFFDDPTCEEI